jgi:hypothetical protein
MNPWIAGQANTERIAELRSLGRPFGLSLVGWRVGRRPVNRARSKPVWRGVSGRSRPLSVRF